MLQSYEAIYEYGAMKWLGDKPPIKQAHVIVTILPEKEVSSITPKIQHQPSPLIAGKGSIQGDIITPIIPAIDWNCLT